MEEGLVPTPAPTPMPDMEAMSWGIVNGVIEDEYGAKGSQFGEKNVPSFSLPIYIEYIPRETVSLAVAMIDPGEGNWVHWLAANIVPLGDTEHAIFENESIDNADSFVQGKNSWGFTGYGGPTPPSGTHKYIITVYALSEMLDLKAGFSADEFTAAIENCLISSYVITGDYSK